MVQLPIAAIIGVAVLALFAFGILIQLLLIKRSEFETLWTVHLRTCNERNDAQKKNGKLMFQIEQLEQKKCERTSSEKSGR